VKDVIKHFAECAGAIVELDGIIRWADTREFERIIGRPIGPKEKLVREGRLFAYGLCADCGRIHPSGRRISYSAKPSRHACNALCMSARGPNCECRCGGKNHGAGFVPSGDLFGEESDAA
jgi:hypothetical protein